MLDRKFIGYEFPPSEKTVASWKVTQFANAIRETNPIYYDIEVARKEGFRGLPVPPTFFSTMTFSSDKNFFDTLGIDYRKLLDGGRELKYYSQCCEGDTLVYQTKVESIVETEGKRGKMDVVTAVTRGKNKQTNEKVYDMIITLIVFH